ncbi:hypothetical protein QE152_g32063 [Popillia japonica]|uniref:Uncharacterized protein n=1 Tax=Popillia japonica TaxID=7064 RepID=A0AAW1IZZ4_POPJA
MGRSRWAANLNIDQQKAIVQGRGQGRIHLKLIQQFNVPEQTITNRLKRWKFRGDYIKIRKSTGRPRITDLVTDRNILQSVRRNLRPTATDIAREISTPHKAAPSIRTI